MYAVSSYIFLTSYAAEVRTCIITDLLVVCGHTVTEAMKNDIAVAQRLGITATTLEGILTVKGQGRPRSRE